MADQFLDNIIEKVRAGHDLNGEERAAFDSMNQEYIDNYEKTMRDNEMAAARARGIDRLKRKREEREGQSSTDGASGRGRGGRRGGRGRGRGGRRGGRGRGGRRGGRGRGRGGRQGGRGEIEDPEHSPVLVIPPGFTDFAEIEDLADPPP